MNSMKTHFVPLPIIQTDRLTLRPFLDSDAKAMQIMRSDERLLKYTEVTKAKTLEDAAAFIQTINTNDEAGESVNWAICLKGDPELIGTICLWNLNPEKGTAEAGYSIHADHWRKGYASEAFSAIIDFGFQTMEANLIEAYSNAKNEASIRLLDKFGFLKTGKEGKYSIYTRCRPPLGKLLLETDRLRLREITPDDAPFLLELLNTPDWLNNIGDRNVRSIEDARKYAIYRLMAAYHKFGFGFYVMERKSDGAKTGMCGLVKRDFLDDIDIGYALLPEFYGQGYAVEAAAAILDFAKQNLKLHRIVAITIESNRPSQRVLEKIGLRFERKFFAPGDEEELMLWGVDL